MKKEIKDMKPQGQFQLWKRVAALCTQKRYDNTNLDTRTCNYEQDFTILNERCTVSKTKGKQRKLQL